MTSDVFPQLTQLRATLIQAVANVDAALNTLRATPSHAEESFQAAVLRAAEQECGSSAYYMYVRIQRKLEAEGFGHVKRGVISGLLLHHGWVKVRRDLGFFWVPPTVAADPAVPALPSWPAPGRRVPGRQVPGQPAARFQRRPG